MDRKKIEKKVYQEKKLVEVRRWKKIILVGDTHGDLEASKKVINNFAKDENIVVFLGDYVDRGPRSKENIEFLLSQKSKNPKNIYLLQGNHEGYPHLKHSPADFWQSLKDIEYEFYSHLLPNLPLVFTASDIIALHGALPDVSCLKDIDRIKACGREWHQITWGDFIDEKGGFLGIDPLTGRPIFGRDWFGKLMSRFNMKLLVRSHQPYSPLWLFNRKCLTLFTSSAYGVKRKIAIIEKQSWESEGKVKIKEI